MRVSREGFCCQILRYSLQIAIAVVVVVLAVSVNGQGGQLGGLFDIPGRVMSQFGNLGGRGSGGRGLQSGNGGVERPLGQSQGGLGEGQLGGQGQGSEGQVQGGQEGQGQGQGGGESQSCIRAAARCNSNIICGTALRKQLPTCQNPILPKRCLKCQTLTSVLTATPEGADYMNCDCGFDLVCRARRRLQQSCLGGQQ